MSLIGIPSNLGDRYFLIRDSSGIVGLHCGEMYPHG
jgi:hypothetical protein